ncbi:MAG: hypothetical protein ACTSP4_00475 [Candidatus Hodarchaeales archaeon]
MATQDLTQSGSPLFDRYTMIMFRRVNIPSSTAEQWCACMHDGSAGTPEHLVEPYAKTLVGFTLGVDEECMGNWDINTGATCTVRFRADAANGNYAIETYGRVVMHTHMVKAETGLDDAYYKVTGLSTAISATQGLKCSVQFTNALVSNGAEVYIRAYFKYDFS